MLNSLKNVKFIYDNGSSLIFTKNDIDKLYISNIDNNGNEIPYEPSIIKNKLIANFILFKFSNNINPKNLPTQSNITNVELIFNNNKYADFLPISNNEPFKENDLNKYQKYYYLNDTACLVISNFKPKYLEYLFI